MSDSLVQVQDQLTPMVPETDQGWSAIDFLEPPISQLPPMPRPSDASAEAPT